VLEDKVCENPKKIQVVPPFKIYHNYLSWRIRLFQFPVSPFTMSSWFSFSLSISRTPSCAKFRLLYYITDSHAGSAACWVTNCVTEIIL
jgi:hypothetical protein